MCVRVFALVHMPQREDNLNEDNVSLLSPSAFWESNSVHSAWWQVTFPANLPHPAYLNIYKIPNCIFTLCLECNTLWF